MQYHEQSTVCKTQRCTTFILLPRSCPAEPSKDGHQCPIVCSSAGSGHAAHPGVTADGNVSVLCLSADLTAHCNTPGASAEPPDHSQPGKHRASQSDGRHVGKHLPRGYQGARVLLLHPYPGHELPHPLLHGISASGPSPGQEGQRRRQK